MKDNTDRLLEAVEHPERFSDEELDMLFQDSNVRDLYATMNKTANLLTKEPDLDIDVEWRRFVSKNLDRKVIRTSFFFNRHVAAVVVAIVASIAVVAASIGFKHAFESSDPKKESVIEKQASSVTPHITERSEPDSIQQKNLPIPETKVFKDETLENIILDISEYYGVSASFKTPVSKELRLYFKWEQSQQLIEVVEQLNNFEHIDIVLNENVLIVE